MEEIPAGAKVRQDSKVLQRNCRQSTYWSKHIPDLAESSWDRRRSSLASQNRRTRRPNDLSHRQLEQTRRVSCSSAGPAVVDLWPSKAGLPTHSRGSTLQPQLASGVGHLSRPPQRHDDIAECPTTDVGPLQRVYNRQDAKVLTDIRRLSSRMCRSSV